MGKRASKDERFGDIMRIPGTDWGMRWEGLSWVLYRWKEMKDKEGASKGYGYDMTIPLYPANLNHLADIVVRDGGAGAKDAKAFFAQWKAFRDEVHDMIYEFTIQQGHQHDGGYNPC